MRSASSASIASQARLRASSFSFLSASRSISSCWMRRSTSSISTRGGLDLHLQPRGGLVDQVDRLVGEEAVGDVALRERRGGDDRRVGDADAVVDLVALLEPAQDRDRVVDVGLADEHRLEAALERRVLLDVLAVLVERGRADARSSPRASIGLSRLAASIAPSAGAGADDRVQLVDEQDDLALGVLDLLEHGLEPLLELAAVLRAGDQRADVERDHAAVAQRLGHVARRRSAGRGPRRSPSCRRRARRSGPGCSWSGARAPGSRGGSPRRGRSPGRACAELGVRGQVAAELLERLGHLLGVRGGDAVRALGLGDRRAQRLAVRAAGRRRPTLVGEREQQVLRRRCTRRRARPSPSRRAAAGRGDPGRCPPRAACRR